MQKLTAALRHKGENWKGALVVDGEFVDTFESKKLSDAAIEMIGEVLSADHPAGTQVTIDITVNPPRERK